MLVRPDRNPHVFYSAILCILAVILSFLFAFYGTITLFVQVVKSDNLATVLIIGMLLVAFAAATGVACMVAHFIRVYRNPRKYHPAGAVALLPLLIAFFIVNAMIIILV